MNDIIITSEMLSDIRGRVRSYLTEKRYGHTLGVEREAEFLGNLYLPEKVNELRAAALFHDITKKLTPDEHISLAEKLCQPLSDADLRFQALLHPKTAAMLIPADFPEYATDEIVSAVRYHSTGHGGMTTFEAIIYLADYIEDTRTFDDCIELRRFFYDRIKNAKTEEEKTAVLYDTMIKSLNTMISLLIEENGKIDNDTVEARNYYIDLREGVCSEKSR